MGSGADETPSINPAMDDLFDAMLRNLLLNYEQVTWRSTPSIATEDHTPTPTVTGGPSAPSYRIRVKESGLYALTYEEISAADPTVDLTSVDPRTFSLANKGEEVAIEVQGEADGVFGPSDTIYFFAEAIDTVYADENVYWLSWSDSPGGRMSVLEARPTGTGTIPTHFVDTRLIESNQVYASNFVSLQGDRWFWRILRSSGAPVTRSFPFESPTLSTESSDATLKGELVGIGALPSQSVAVSLNGHVVYTATWASSTSHTFEVEVPSSYLAAGVNAIAVTNGIDNSRDGLLVDGFSLTYGAPYTAINDTLWFDGENAGINEFHLTDFTTSTLTVLDVTSPTQPSRITGWTAQLNSNGYTIAFEQTLQDERRYLATATALAHSPIAVERDAYPTLKEPGNSADYIVITPSDFVTAAQTLAAYRETQGLRTTVVDLQHIYDEFNHGIPDAEAIRGFLSHAYEHWTPPAPAYIVLLGDGHYDPKDNLRTGVPSPIPPYLADVDPWIRETAADNRYVAVHGDDLLPDMFLGRLPANTLTEAEALVNKVIGYEQAGVDIDWRTNHLFVADNEDDAGDFASLSDQIADHFVNQPYQVEKIHLGVTHP